MSKEQIIEIGGKKYKITPVEEEKQEHVKLNGGLRYVSKKHDYYSIGDTGYINYFIFNMIADKKRIDNLNSFATKEEAELEAKKQKLMREIRQFAYEKNGELDWYSNKNSYKIGFSFEINNWICFKVHFKEDHIEECKSLFLDRWNELYNPKK